MTLDPDDASADEGGASPAAGESAAHAEGLPYQVQEHDGVRTVTYTSTAEDGTVNSIVTQHMVGVTHWYAPAPRNEPIPLYAGPFALDGDAYTGAVTQVWTPHPQIRVAGAPKAPQSLADAFAAFAPTTDLWVTPGEFVLPQSDTLPPPPDPAAVSDGTAGGGTTKTNVIRVGATEGFEEATFLVPNGWSAWDGIPVGDPGDPTQTVMGGVAAQEGGWEVFVHPRTDGNPDTRLKTLTDEGGYEITHVGRLRRIDGAVFSDEDMVDALTTLRLCFSLACGRTTTALHPVAWAGGEPVAARWTGAPVDGPRNMGGWLDQTIASQQVKELLERALTFAVDPAKQRLLRHAVSFLVTANYDVDVELAVAVSTSALHMLSFERLVNDKQAMTAKDHENARTEEVIRALLDDCSIDTQVPSHFHELAKSAATLKAAKNDGSEPDALTTIVWMRNKIIHPTKTLPHVFSVYEWAEASIFTRHLLTLAILNLIGYTGDHRSPVAVERWTGVVTPVPWAATSAPAAGQQT